MDPALRLATAAGAASVLAAGLFIALRNVPGHEVYLGRSAGAVTSMPVAVFVAVLALLAVGFGYLLTAAAAASPRVAIPAIVLLVAGIGVYTGAFGSLIGGLDLLSILPGWARWTCRGILALTLVTSVTVNLADRRLVQRRRVPRLIVLLAHCGLIGGYLATLDLASPTVGGFNEFGPIVTLLIGQLVFLIFPLLQVAATDYAEWGELTAQRVAAAVPSRWARAASTVLALTASLGLAWFGYNDLSLKFPLASADRLSLAAKNVGLAAAVVLVLLAAGRLLHVRRRAWPQSIGFGGIVAACAVGSVLVPPVVTAVVGGVHRAPDRLVEPDGRFAPGADVIAVRPSGPAAFSILIPRGWQVHTTGNTVVASRYAAHDAVERIVAEPVPPVTIRAAAREVGLTDFRTASVGGSQVALGSLGPDRGALWLEPLPSSVAKGVYAIEERASAAFPDPYPLLTAIATSLRPPGTPAAVVPGAEVQDVSQHEADKRRGVGLLAEVIVFVVLLALLLGVGRHWSGRVTAAIYLLGTLIAFEVVFFLPEIGRLIAGRQADWPHLGVAGLLLSVGLGGAVVSGVAAARDRRDDTRLRRTDVEVVGLVGATAGLAAMNALYTHALDASSAAVWAAVILLVAVAWDVTMSGESMTNLDSPHLPRPTRVLGFLGYVIVLGGCVLFFTSQHLAGSGATAEPFFEAEAATQSALFRVGFPLLLMMFLLRTFGGEHSDGEDNGEPITTSEAPKRSLPA